MTGITVNNLRRLDLNLLVTLVFLDKNEKRKH